MEVQLQSYEILAGEIRLERRYRRGECVSLSGPQAKYLLLAGLIAPAKPASAPPSDGTITVTPGNSSTPQPKE